MTEDARAPVREPEPLSADERKRLLLDLSGALDPSVEADQPIQSFLPLRQHERLLTGRAVLVQGERGAGKTALFRFLGALHRRDIHRIFSGAPSHLTWAEGFSSSSAHPPAQALHAWSGAADDLTVEVFWLGHLAGVLRALPGTPKPPAPLLAPLDRWANDRNDLDHWVAGFREHLGVLYGWLDTIDARLTSQEAVVMIGYDDLDTITVSGQLATAARLSARLVAVWVSLTQRWRSIQARVFLRPDLAALARTATTDASKLRAFTIDLTWSPEDIFRVLIRRMGAAANPRQAPLLRGWLERAPSAVRYRDDDVLGAMPPHALPETAPPRLDLPFGMADRESGSQERVATRLAGRTMGSGPNKGYTHTWILNHSRDALQRHLPRLTLNLIRNAAEVALLGGPQARGIHLLLPSHLEEAQAPTGEQRMEELTEQYPVVQRMFALRDKTAPFPREDAVRWLGAAAHRPGDDHDRDGEAVLRQLTAIGLLTERPPARGQGDSGGGARVDVPDVFRKALSIGRKGGPLQLPRVHIAR